MAYYNPYAYAPGGSSPLVSRATMEAGYGLGSPTFDLEGLLRNDPMRLGQLRQIGWGDEGATGAGMLGQALAPIDEARRAQLINYGDIPAGVNADDTLRGLASDATRGGLSTLAQLRHAQLLANSAAAGSAGARGLGRSGSLGYHTAANQYGYDAERARQQAALMQSLGQLDQQRVGAFSTAMGQAQTANTDAFQRLISQINAGTIAAPGNLTGARLPLGPAPVPYVPRTNPGTFHASPVPQIGAGQPGNKFQVLPGRGRAPFGDYRTAQLPAAYGGRALR